MTFLDWIAAFLLVEAIATIPAAGYVIVVYLQARRSLVDEVPPLYTLAALLCGTTAVCGVAMAALVAFYFAHQEFPYGGLLLTGVLAVLLSVPVVMAAVIWRLRRHHS